MTRAGRAALLLLAALPLHVRAHDAGISYSELSVDGDRIAAALRISAADLAAALAREQRGDTHRDPLRPDARAIAETLGRFDLSRGGRPCRLEPGAVRSEPPDGVRLTAAFRCDRRGEALHVRVGMLERLPWGHTHVAKVVVGARDEEHVARAGREGFEIQAPPSRWAQASRFLRLGLEHIFTGYDHVAFVMGLLLLGGTLRGLARLVTSFTLAHSVTLALASLDVVRLPARLVEPLIAASIVFVAIENLLELRRPSPRADGRRWRLGFAFGLVHGFGFAGALAELHLSPGDLATALLSFNGGVELGQAVLVAVAYPGIAALRRSTETARLALRAGSLGIGAAGVLWLVERLPWR